MYSESSNSKNEVNQSIDFSGERNSKSFQEGKEKKSQVFIEKSMEYHLKKLEDVYKSRTQALEKSKVQLKSLESDLALKREKVHFMKRDVLNARKTWRRKIAESFQYYEWYKPIISADDDDLDGNVQNEVISLSDGWEYYENYILPR